MSSRQQMILPAPWSLVVCSHLRVPIWRSGNAWREETMSDGREHSGGVAGSDRHATVEELKSRGVELLNGPMERPWGIRTASFRDPGGHIWEVAY
jgi:hypothetical protein